MTTYNPSVKTTIFPRINFYKNFTGRAVRRDFNGRIYGKFGKVSIDSDRYPPLEGAECIYEGITELDTLDWDLGDDVTVAPTKVVDLRLSCGSYRVFDLLINSIDSGRYPPVEGAQCMYEASPDLNLQDWDLGADVTVTPANVVDLRLTCGGDRVFDLLTSPIDRLADYPAASGATALADEYFPVDLGPAVTAAPSGNLDLRLTGGDIDLNPLN